MTTVPAERQHVDTAIVAARKRDNIIVAGEVIRHRRATRLIHWTVALTFFIALFSGMPSKLSRKIESENASAGELKPIPL